MIFKTQRAQAIVEYIILLVVVLGLVVVSLNTSFLERVKGTFENYHQGIVTRAASG